MEIQTSSWALTSALSPMLTSATSAQGDLADVTAAMEEANACAEEALEQAAEKENYRVWGRYYCGQASFYKVRT